VTIESRRYVLMKITVNESAYNFIRCFKYRYVKTRFRIGCINAD